MTSVTVYGYSRVLLLYVRDWVPLVYRYFYLIARLNKIGVVYWYGIWVSQCLYNLINPTNGTLWWFHNYQHILIFPLWHRNIFVIIEISHWFQFTKKKQEKKLYQTYWNFTFGLTLAFYWCKQILGKTENFFKIVLHCLPLWLILSGSRKNEKHSKWMFLIFTTKDLAISQIYHLRFYLLYVY